MTRIIDVRGRPTALDPFYGGEPGSEREQRIEWVNARVGSNDPRHFTKSRTVDEFLKEAEEAGISKTVVLGRQVPMAAIPNDRIAELVSRDERLVGIGAVDPSSSEAGGVVGAVEEVRRAIEELGLAGINVDPGFGETPMLPDDRRLYPVYAACEGLGVPLFFMSGPLAGPSLEYTHPDKFAAVAGDFPSLNVVVAHGAYPFVDEAIGVAYKHERLHLSPDIYTFMTGGMRWVKAARGFLRDQLLFGTGYPFRSMQQTVDDYRELPWGDEVVRAVMHDNAARVLDLER